MNELDAIGGLLLAVVVVGYLLFAHWFEDRYERRQHHS